MTNHILHVPDLSCGHCVATVTTALADVPGLSDCRVDLRQKQVRFSLTDAAQVPVAVRRLGEAGYPAQILAG